MKQKKKAEEFYGELIDLFKKNNIPFLIGGTHALEAYTGVVRPTKDMDFFCNVNQYPGLLKLASDAGYKTELLDELWIAKVHDGKFVADIIFAERNGLEKVNDSWFKIAGEGKIFNRQVDLVPVEEMIRSKAYVQNKERYDGCDVINLILRCSNINWKLLRDIIEPNWEVLFAHLINFSFVYPNEIAKIPKWLLADYIQRLQIKISTPKDKNNRVTRGLLISWHYRVAIEQWGYKPVSPFFSSDHEQSNS